MCKNFYWFAYRVIPVNSDPKGLCFDKSFLRVLSGFWISLVNRSILYANCKCLELTQLFNLKLKNKDFKRSLSQSGTRIIAIKS